MADNKTLDNGALTDIPVATVEGAFSGDTVDVQLVCLAVSSGAEGGRTIALAPGDSTDGVLVNLGTNNDVTVTGSLTNISGTISLPTGASTSANQTTIIGHLDGVEGLLTTIDGDTGNISTKIDTIAGAISSAKMQVDVVTLPALAAGTNNIGDVDVITLPGTAAEGAALPGVFVVVAGDDGTDTQPLQLTAGGDLKISLDGETVTVQGSNIGVIGTDFDIRNMAKATDSISIGDATNLVSVATVGADAVSNTLNVLASDARLSGFNGTTWDRLRSDTTNGLDVDVTRVGGTVTVTGSVTANAGTNLNTSTLALESGGNLAGAATSLAVIDDWDETDRAKVNIIVGQAGIAAGAGAVGVTVPRVTLASDDPVTTAVQVMDDWDESDRAKVNLIVGQAGVTAGAGAVAANTPRVTHASDDPVTTAVQLIDDCIFADDAGFTIATSKVAVTGGYVVAHGSNPDAADAADAGAFLMNRHRIPFVLGGHPNIQSAEYYTTGTQTDDTIMPAISTGTKYVITYIAVIASAANTVNTSVRIGFGTANVPTQGASGADATTKVIVSHPNIPAGSGITKGNGSGIIGIGGDGEELRITCSAPTTGSLIVQVDYFTIES